MDGFVCGVDEGVGEVGHFAYFWIEINTHEYTYN